MVNLPLGIGLTDDPKTCAYCAKPVKVHTGAMIESCRANLSAKNAQVAAVSKEKQLDDLDEQISALEDKRKELKLEIEKEEILEKILSGEIDLTAAQEQALHKECPTKADIDDAQSEAEDARGQVEEIRSEAWGYLREFGSHTAACLSGALVGEKRPHPLCTCGWNHVATEAER